MCNRWAKSERAQKKKKSERAQNGDLYWRLYTYSVKG